MERKGQAAMEFLMTYGWAILAAIIAIGVLAYFGVFSPGKFVPSATVINAPLYANAWNVLSTTEDVNIEIKNNGGDTITLRGFTLTNPESPTGTSVVCPSNLTTSLVALTPGSSGTVGIKCTTDLTAGDTFKADVAVVYTKTGSSLNLTSTGTITATVA